MSRNTNRSTVTSKGQVTIPKQLRDRMGVRAGEVLEFEERAGELVARKTAGQTAVDAAYGVLDLGARTDEIVDALRGPRESS